MCVYLFFFFLIRRRPPRSTRTYTLFPYTTLFRSVIFLLLSPRRRHDRRPRRGFVHADGPADAYGKAKKRHRSGCTEEPRANRSEERRVGKESVSTCRSGWKPCHEKKQRRDQKQHPRQRTR